MCHSTKLNTVVSSHDKLIETEHQAVTHTHITVLALPWCAASALGPLLHGKFMLPQYPYPVTRNIADLGHRVHPALENSVGYCIVTKITQSAW